MDAAITHNLSVDSPFHPQPSTPASHEAGPPIPKMGRLCVLGIIALLVGSLKAHAGPVSLPPVNLGDTSFIDGLAYPGWLYEETINGYHADQFNGAGAQKLPGRNTLTTFAVITHLAYLSHYQLFGGYFGAEVLLPLAGADLELSSQPRRREEGMGDLIVSPFILQWNDERFFGRPFFQRFDIAMDLPTGRYDSSRALNIGNNVVTLNPYYAFTIFPTPKLELSARLHYLWNSENDSPYDGLRASSIQPGQAFHANVATSYEVLKGVRLGINGYVLQQLTDDQMNGHTIANSKERVFGVGPGLVYNRDKFWIYLNSYFETGAENRPEGTKVTLRFSLAF
jgi:hypothetical protein